MSTAIEFNHVGKQYRLGVVSTKTLSHDLNRWWQMSILGKEDPYLKIGETNDRALSIGFTGRFPLGFSLRHTQTEF